MFGLLHTIVWCLLRRLVNKSATEVDVAALHHQVVALQRQVPGRQKLTPWDRFFFSVIYKVIPRSLVNMLIVKPDSVVRWHRAGFRLFSESEKPLPYWAAKSTGRDTNSVRADRRETVKSGL